MQLLNFRRALSSILEQGECGSWQENGVTTTIYCNQHRSWEEKQKNPHYGKTDSYILPQKNDYSMYTYSHSDAESRAGIVKCLLTEEEQEVEQVTHQDTRKIINNTPIG